MATTFLTLIPFTSGLDLALELHRALIAISYAVDKFGECGTITLWHSEDRGLKVFSQMHDIAPKIEVGVLNFCLAQALDEGEEMIRFGAPLMPVSAEKLLMKEQEVILESGLKLVFEDKTKLVVVPSAFPCFISVSAKFLPIDPSTPEYKIEDYRPIELFGAAQR